MAEFTYLPGPGDYTIMILDRGSSFASIDWERIGWEEAVRRVNLFCASPSMLALLEKALPIIEEEAERRESVLPDQSTRAYSYWSEMRDIVNEIRAEIERVRGREASDGD